MLKPVGIERAEFLKPFYHRFKRALKKGVAEVEGFTLHLDAGDCLDLSLSSDYERFERTLLGQWVHPGDTVLDIGAHIGFFTLFLSRLVEPGGHVFSFEPCPTNRRLLEKNIEVNHRQNVTVVPAAVGDRSGPVSFFLNPENSGDHHIHARGEETPSLEVESIRLDAYPPLQETAVPFIKMDIQGAELQALKGMAELLDRNAPLRILMEYWPAGLKRAGTDPLNLLEFLFARGFRVFHLNEADESIQEILAEEGESWLELLEKSFADQPERHTNLLAEKGSPT